MLKKLICAFLLFSIHANTMEIASPDFNEDIFIVIVSKCSNAEEIVKLRLVCQTWNNFFLPDELWKQIYIKKRHTEEKLIKELTYKQNYFTPLLVCHTTKDIPFGKIDINMIGYKEIISDSTGTYEQCDDILTEAFDLYPQVFSSCFGFYSGGEKMEEFLVKALNIAKNRDILVILPAGNDSAFCSPKATGIDLHEEYPNVMWVTSCTAEKEFCTYSNVGALVDVAIEGTSGTSRSALNFSQSVIYLRKLRPSLTAPQIRCLILETAIRTEKSIECLLKGGFFDFEATKKAAKEFGIKTPSPSETVEKMS